MCEHSPSTPSAHSRAELRDVLKGQPGPLVHVDESHGGAHRGHEALELRREDLPVASNTNLVRSQGFYVVPTVLFT